MKYSIKVNEVRAKEGSNIKGFATVVFGDSFICLKEPFYC